MQPRSNQPDFSRRIVLFGGSFDPVHLGHLRLALGCFDQIPALAGLYFVPCFLSPFKESSQASVEERLRLLEIALDHSPFQIWDFEARRQESSFTIETLKEAHRRGATRESLFLLLGADAYEGLPRWREGEDIREYCQIIVGNRPGYDIQLQSKLDREIHIEPIDLASHNLREDLAETKIPRSAFPASLEEEFRRLFLNSKNAYAKKLTMQDGLSAPTSSSVTLAKSPKQMSPRELAEYCGSLAFEKKALNVVVLDLGGRSSVADHFLIMSATSQPQVTAIAEHIHKELRSTGYKIPHEEGFTEGRWAVLDLGDVVVHIFIDYMRDFYNLEGLWKDAPRRRLEDRT